MSESDVLVLADEHDRPQPVTSGRRWVILIVDDEEEVHVVTELALGGFEFQGHPIEMVNAYSGEEAKRIMDQREDIAMVLLDVVMETDTAGLEVVQYIRETLKNKFVRIVLRTGQPGQAPEYSVITNYDINDYKEKTELTRQKLFTCVYTSLSSYRDLLALETHRQGLLKVIHASADMFECNSMDAFTQGVIEQVSALMYLEQDMIFVRASGISVEKHKDRMEIVAATGRFKELAGRSNGKRLAPEIVERINLAYAKGENCYGVDYFVGCYKPETDITHLLYVAGDVPMSKPDSSLVELFTKNVAIAHEKLLLILKTGAAG